MRDRKWRESSLLVFINKPIIARPTAATTTVVLVGTDMRTLLALPSALTSFRSSQHRPPRRPKLQGSSLSPQSLPIRRTVVLIVRPRPLLPAHSLERVDGRGGLHVHTCCDMGRRGESSFIMSGRIGLRTGRRPFRTALFGLDPFLLPSLPPAQCRTASLPRLPPRLPLSLRAPINTTIDGFQINFSSSDIVF